MTDFAGLRPSIDKMSLRSIDRLPYQDGPPDDTASVAASDTFERLDKASTRPLSPVPSENEAAADGPQARGKSFIKKVLGALRLNRAG